VTLFKGSKIIFERGIVAGTRVGVVFVISVFLAALIAVFLVLVLFWTLSCSAEDVVRAGDCSLL